MKPLVYSGRDIRAYVIVIVYVVVAVAAADFYRSMFGFFKRKNRKRIF